MDHEVNTQGKTSQSNQEETSQEGCMTNQVAAGLEATYADLDLTNMDGQLQTRLNTSIKEGQRQEEATKNQSATHKQIRTKHSDQLTDHASPTCQPTLHNVGSPIYCMGELGTLGSKISINGPRSQGPRTMLAVITEAPK